MNKTLKTTKEVVLKTIVGLLIFGGFMGIVLISNIVGEKLGLSEDAQLSIYYFLFILVAGSLISYNFKKARKLNLKYFKNLIRDISQIIIALGGSLLFIIILIGAGIAIFNLATGIIKLGTIPVILIIILIVVGSRLERIEEELRELRERHEDRYNDYNEFK